MESLSGKLDTNTGRKLKNIKRHNQRLVLSLFENSGTLSNSEIAARTKLSKTTISKIFGDFIARGLVYPAGKGVSTEEGGKKPDLYRLNEGYRHILVFLLVEPGVVEGAVLDLQYNIVCREVRRTAPECSYKDVLQVLADSSACLINTSKLTFDNICGIAIACEGIVDAAGGIIRHPIHHAWDDHLPVRSDLEQILPYKVPIYVDNVCRFGGYAELLNTKKPYSQNIITIWSSSLAGGCVLIQEQMVQGASGMVGEFGHMVLEPESKTQCSCGGFGCFESLVSQETVLQNARQLWPEYPDSILASKVSDDTLCIGDIFSASNKEDTFARILLDRVIRYYSILIHNIAILHDPREIIIQGIYASAGDYFLDSLRRQVACFPFYEMIHDIEIVYSNYKNEDYFFTGSAFYVSRQFFYNVLFSGK